MSVNEEFKEFFVKYYVKYGFVYSEKEALEFYEAGQRQGMEEAYADTAEIMHTAYGDNKVSRMFRKKSVDARKEIKP